MAKATAPRLSCEEKQVARATCLVTNRGNFSNSFGGNQMDGFDFSSIDVKKTSVMEVKHPTTGNLTGASIELAGPEHEKRKAIEMANARRVRAQFSKTGKVTLDDPEDDEQKEIDKCVSCTLSWNGVKIGGKAIECNAANARTLYQNAPWLREQVLMFLAEKENFIVDAVTS